VTAPSSAIAARKLCKRFGANPAVEDLTLEVPRGSAFALLGPNGAGKTTSVRMLTALLEPTSGAAEVCGHTLGKHDDAIRRACGLLTEVPGLYPRLSAVENLLFFAELYDLRARDARPRIERWLKRFDLWDRRADPVGGFSTGMKQKLALSRALVHEPDLLFLDEPTSGLDPVAARDVYELIGDLRGRGVTIFLTTHRLEEAERLCDRVAILNTTLRTIGRPDELRDRLFAKTLTVRTAAPLPEPASVFAGLPGVDGWRDDGAQYVLSVTEPSLAAPAVARALVAAGADVLSIGESRHSLEDVYLELVADEGATRTW
jgi:ABC-2 type transport system ATP-binding protein